MVLLNKVFPKGVADTHANRAGMVLTLVLQALRYKAQFAEAAANLGNRVAKAVADNLGNRVAEAVAENLEAVADNLVAHSEENIHSCHWRRSKYQIHHNTIVSRRY
jgi:hypothetical protein